MADKQTMVSQQASLPGRTSQMPVPPRHFVNGRNMLGSDGLLVLPDGFERAMFGMGCFWGVEKKFWQQRGVYLTAVGYAGGFTPNPTYDEVCTGMTGHNEVVAVVFDPAAVSYEALLKLFWESHNPTQGMRQGNDRGTQYRSGIYVYSSDQLSQAQQSRQRYQVKLSAAGYAEITTEVVQAPTFYFAEPYHQQYLAKNPAGYCGLGGLSIDYGEVES